MSANSSSKHLLTPTLFDTSGKKELIISIKEYRHIFHDQNTSDKDIEERIEYVEMFCRKIIRLELEKHAKRKK